MQTNGNRHHSEGVADTNAAWAEYVNGLVHQSTMDILHAVVDEVTKLIEGVNGDFNKSIDVCDAKIKAAIATCERTSAEMRSNVPAIIDEAVGKHVAQAMANVRQPVDGAPGPVGPPGKLEIVKDHVEGRVYYERDLVVAANGALYQAERDTAATPHIQTGAASRALAAMARMHSTSASKARMTPTRNIVSSRS
jgi:hypothetical protein